MPTIKRFEDIEAWKVARELDFELYKCYGEARSQLYRVLDREYITKEKFEELKLKTENINGKIAALMNYLI